MGHYLISYGGVGEVTGSMHMIVFNEDLENETKILLDAGGFQGFDSYAKNAYLPGSINPMDIKYIFLTHSHYDHIGRLPMLVQRGFSGKIICTPTTRYISYRMLDDMLYIQKGEIERVSISPLTGLFDEKDVEKTKRLFDNSGCTGDDDYPEWEEKDKDGNTYIKIRFIPSEHILGSASILVLQPIRLLYTGDIGGGRSNLHGIPKPSGDVDYLMIESTYGNRNMEKSDVLQLSETIEDIKKSGGRLLIPVLAVDRTEEILYLLRKLGIKEKVYLDTPMGVDILDIYSENKFLLSRIKSEFTTGIPGIKEERNINDLKKIFRPENFQILYGKVMSTALVDSNESCIILASSGMLQGGRIMQYLPRLLEDDKNILLFTSYQAEGSLGRMILDGAKEVNYEIFLYEVHTEGEDLRKEYISKRIISNVKCQIRKIEGLSAHADMNGLLNYINEFEIFPGKIFIVHGEKDVSEVLSGEIKKRFRTKTTIMAYNVRYDLNECGIVIKEKVKDISNIQVLKENGILRFWNVGEKLIASFAGWVVDNGDNYSLASQEEIQNMLERHIGIKNIGGVESLDSQNATTAMMEIKNEKKKENDINDIDVEDKEVLGSIDLINTLFTYYNEGYISKGLIKSLIENAEKGMNEYTKTIEKRIRGKDLILDDIELERRGSKEKFDKEKRDELGEKLGNILKRSTKMNRDVLCGSLTNIRNEIKDM